MTKSPAQRAYEAWLLAHSGPHAMKLTPWQNLQESAKSVWRAVAKAARDTSS